MDCGFRKGQDEGDWDTSRKIYRWSFHVWETELGEKIASHVTLFRDKTIKGLFEKDWNELSMFKDMKNRRFQTYQ